MMLCCIWPQYSADLPDKVVSAALSISGLYDLTEIVKVPSVNGDVRLNEKAALKVSPAFLPVATDAPFYTAVGSEENDGFHVQNRLIAKKWGKALRAEIACPGANHFTVLDRLCDSSTDLFKAAVDMAG